MTFGYQWLFFVQCWRFLPDMEKLVSWVSMLVNIAQSDDYFCEIVNLVFIFSDFAAYLIVFLKTCDVWNMSWNKWSVTFFQFPGVSNLLQG